MSSSSTLHRGAHFAWRYRQDVIGWALVLLCVAFGAWVGFAYKNYRRQYAQATDHWRVGSTRLVELTVTPADRDNLACASDFHRAGLACEYRSDLLAQGPKADDRKLLRPYKTVQGELFVAAGLWTTPAMQGRLPADRFSVLCSYDVVGVVNSLSFRWLSNGEFQPIAQSVAAGVLSDCKFPQ